MKHLPLRPLLDRSGGLGGLARALGFQSKVELERSCNLAHWYQTGVPWWAADELAAAVNLHPLNVWGEEWARQSETIARNGVVRKVDA